MYHSSSFRVSNAPPKNLQILLVNAILNNKQYLLEVSYWITISELKRKIEKSFGIPVANQRLFFKAQELTQNNFSMISFGGQKKIKIILRPTPNLENSLGLVKRYETLPKTPVIDELLFWTQEGFNLGLIPKLTFEGTSGTYFLHNKFRKKIGVFKPFDEEPMTPNNPKGYPGKMGSNAFKPGILSGESAVREVAVYLLDQCNLKYSAGVPPTTFVEIIHPYFTNRDMKEKEITTNPNMQASHFLQFTNGAKKIIIKHGSLQQFVQGAEEASDFAPTKFPDDEVRKIAILDLRILNCDRNEGNILVKRGNNKELQLIPIDHGLCFPDSFEANIYDIIWMEWPHVHKPWTLTELDFIRKIDPKADIEKLTKHFKFRDICLRNFRIAETVLKKFALAGLTIHEIGTFMYRDDPEIESPIEAIIKETEEFVETMRSSRVKDIFTRLAQLSPRKKKPVTGFTIEKNKPKELIFDPLVEAYDSLRTRSYSHEVDQIESLPQNMLKSILEASETESDTKLFTIPELGRHMSEVKSLQRLYPQTQLKKNSSVLLSLSSQEIKSESETAFSEEEREEDDEEQNICKELSAPTILKRSSSIPSVQTKLFFPGGTPKNGKKENSPLLIKQKKKKERTVHYAEKETPLYKDELFFKYFDAFLNQKLEIILKTKNAIPTRGRFLSDYQ